MHPLIWWKSLRLATALAGALVVTVTAPAAPLTAAQVPGSVSPVPASGTPELVSGGTPTKWQRISQLVQCGSIMYAVGIFGAISQNGQVYSRSNVFSFGAAAPYPVIAWSPRVNGRVNTIAFNGSDCAHAYIGGDFTSVDGAPVRNIAELDTSTGALVTSFGHSASGPVDTIIGVAGHLLAGGQFTAINGSATDPYFASLNPVTGQDDGFLQLQISGKYDYCGKKGQCTSGLHTSVSNQQLSHGGTLDLAEGDFTSVGGLPRQQIFMLNLATDPATVTGWTSPQWDGSDGNLPGGYPYQCMPIEAFYIRSAAWSPDDQTVYIATTGFHPWNQPTGSYPRTGLCDVAAAFPAAQTSVTDEWIEYTGCDSYYSVVADSGTVYAAGHPRWAENDHGCDFAGPGAVRDHGLQGLNPGTGDVEVGTDGKPVYSMARANASYMLITGAGLWIGSSNRFGASQCAHQAGHAGICFFPYP